MTESFNDNHEWMASRLLESQLAKSIYYNKNLKITIHYNLRVDIKNLQLERSKYLYGLEALPVDDARAGLVVLLLGDPHLLEGGEGGQDGSSDPDRVLPLGGSEGT